MNRITMHGREYPIHMSLFAIGQIQKRYGKVENLAEKIAEVSELPWILSLLINEGQKLEAYELGTPARTIDEATVGTLLSWRDLNDGGIAQAVVDCFNESIGGEKNLTAEDMMKIAQTKIR